MRNITETLGTRIIMANITYRRLNLYLECVENEFIDKKNGEFLVYLTGMLRLELQLRVSGDCTLDATNAFSIPVKSNQH